MRLLLRSRRCLLRNNQSGLLYGTAGTGRASAPRAWSKSSFLNMNATREKQNTLTAHDDAITTVLAVQFATTRRDLMRNQL